MNHQNSHISTDEHDYLKKYLIDGVFRFDLLVDDDFVRAIRLCGDNGYYVSALKLLMSLIDSIGYVVDSRGNPFISWLNKYCDLSNVGVTAEELWEFRNSLLHMTSLDSRKVKKGEVKRLMAYVDVLSRETKLNSEIAKYFNAEELTNCVIIGIQRFYREATEKQLFSPIFFSKYDEIVSDRRTVNVPDPNNS